MHSAFPSAVPELPVADIDHSVNYYEHSLGFRKDWGDAEDGIAGISRGDCRLFLTGPAFREMHGNKGPLVIWINLNSRQEVNDLHDAWKNSRAQIVSGPEAKPWKLHEFTAADPDGNLLRVFYDFSREG